MAEEKVELREFNIRQVLPWTELFRSFQVALDPKKLLLAAAGILMMAFGWWVLAAIFYGSTSEPQWTAPKDGAAKTDDAAPHDDEAWTKFKEDRHKWNVLHAAAGTSPGYTDIGDLANSPKEFNELATVENTIKEAGERAVKDFEERGETKPREVNTPIGTKTVFVKPAGALRTWPWFESRGPNPYLLVTGQASIPNSKPVIEWLATDENKVLLEPLYKFLYPVVALLSPRTGVGNRFYFLFVTLWTLGTWALFGGAITRMASVQVARNDKIGMGEALRFVTARYYSFLSAPLFPLLFVAFMVVLLSLYGFFFMIPIVGDIVVAGLGYPLIILAGLAMAVVLVGLVGWPMMYATISAEGSDSFDAISRSYSYVYQSPWHYAWYSLVSLAYGAVVVFFVGFMGSLVVYLGKWGVTQTPFIESANRDPSFLFVYAPTSFGWRTLLLQGTTVDGDPIVKQGSIDPAAYEKYVNTFQWYNYAGAIFVTAWLYLFFLLILGFGYSYFWSASTIIYLLMRRKVDDTDLDEVYLEEDEAEESYSAATPAPGRTPEPSPGGDALQLDTSKLRPAAPPSEPQTEPTAAKQTAPAGGDANPPPPGDGASS